MIEQSLLYCYNKIITHAYRLNENDAVQTLLDYAKLTSTQLNAINKRAEELVKQLRQTKEKQGGLDAFLATYDLSTDEGIVLMCIAEAMLRIPDDKTIDSLIRDKLTSVDWKGGLGKSDSLFVNIATWALMLTGKVIEEDENQSKRLGRTLKNLTKRASEPIIRKAVAQAMKVLGKQFVMGENIIDALDNAQSDQKKGYSHSFDMLGEGARTDADAERYFNAYVEAIKAIGENSKNLNVIQSPGISIKLSALYPRYEFTQSATAIPILAERLLSLACLAKQYAIGLTVDAEEADRLALSLEIIETVFLNPNLNGWEGFGLAVQAYQKRAFYLIDWLHQLSKLAGRKIALRLVKGAYWDSEIKLSQELGLNDYPVFTRKSNTDVSYIACVKKILSFKNSFYPQFATHNPHSLSVILELVDDNTKFEFQCLHGMGQSLYDNVLNMKNIQCRVYAPVGNHKDLLPYLVRRLLENGANTSFVNQIMDKELDINDIIADPLNIVAALKNKKHDKIPLPMDLYGRKRKNSSGIDLSDQNCFQQLSDALHQAAQKDWFAFPTDLKKQSEQLMPVFNPANQQIIGQVQNAQANDVDEVLNKATQAAFAWNAIGAIARAKILENIANLLEQHRAELMCIAINEAGKTIPDALSEIREAVDFCRYYAAQARKYLQPIQLPGPTGESNQLEMHGRGVFVCISPWNFPLAIFTGQVVAALVAGNCVIAKPAGQTPLIAAAAVELFHQAGIPRNVLQLFPGSGSMVGNTLLPDQRVNGVIFTGSTEVAKTIQLTLAEREGAIVPFIAETGGQNAMLVMSSALAEQVIDDVIRSAFGSAGQRCSALRVLFVQEDIAEPVLEMLTGAMAKINVGDPNLLATDVGPVIDAGAKTELQNHINIMKSEANVIYEVELSKTCEKGQFIAPIAFEIESLKQLTREVFGPILHVIRFKLSHLDTILDDINNTGYGLTLGIHSRVEEQVRYIHSKLKVGNTYVNRNMIGAVVGVQPFGGEGLSGTGPKAGGPHYLPHLCVERTLTIDITATGGNASLLTLD